ncbi:MAG: Cna B-type domain-containing protein [Lachnospiraceae bacterium]|nr:Cna B-type domain-containing protein [Lachnospiraceae bacterium]
MKENVFGRIYKWRRVWAILGVFIMFASLIVLPDRDLSRVEASTPLNSYIIGTPTIKVYNKDKGVYEEVTDPNVVYDGSEIQISLNYSLPTNLLAGKNPSNDDDMTFTYELPGTIDFVGASETGMSGDINSSTLNGKAGTYVIVEEPAGSGKYVVKITFIKDVYDYNTGQDGKKAQEINGNFYFACDADLEENNTLQEFSFDGKSTGIFIVPSEDKYDINTSKDMTYDEGTGKITNTVTIGTTKGTRGAITFSDSFENYVQYLKAPSPFTLSVTMPDNTVVDYSNKVVVSGNTFKLKDGEMLPALTAGQSYKISYELEQNIDSNANVTGTWEENRFTAKAVGEKGETSGKDQSTSNKSVELKHSLVEKSAKDNGDGTITYTITLNKAHENMKGLLIKDVMTLPESENITSDTELKDRISGVIVTATPAASGETAASIDNEKALNIIGLSDGTGYTVSENDNNSYVITYTYSMVNKTSDVGRTFKNKINSGPNSADGDVYVGPTDYQTKAASTPVAGTDGLTIGWTLKVKNPSATAMTGTYTEDVFSAADNKGNAVEQYLTAPVTINPSAGVTVTYYAKDGTTPVTPSASTPAYSMKVNYTSIDAGAEITITYNTYAPYKIGEADNVKQDSNYKYTFTNTAIYKDSTNKQLDKETPATTYEYKSLFKKYSSDSTWGNWIDGSSSTPRTIDYSSDARLYYVIEIKTKGAATEDLVLKDTIPAGTTLETASPAPALKRYWVSGDDITSKLSYSGTGGEVTFTISKDELPADRTVYLMYALKLPSKAPEGTVGNVAVFENTMEGAGDKSSVTQKVNYDVVDGDKIINKEDPAVDPENSTATYQIVVNRDGIDVDGDPSTSTITLTDVLSVNEDYVAGLNIKSIGVYNYDESKPNNKGAQLGSSDYSYQTPNAATSGGNIQSTLIVTIPDNTPLIVEYTYKFSFSSNYKTDASGTRYVPITNEAHLTGGHSAKNENFEYHVTSSGGSAVMHPSIDLYKVSAKNFATKLSGATFKLDYFDTESGTFKTAVENVPVTVAGIKMDSNLKEGENESITGDVLSLHSHTLYRLTEKEAPPGYILSTDAHYMIFGNEDNSVSKLRNATAALVAQSGIDSNNIKFVAANQEYPIKNEPSGDTFINVKKVWKDTSGNEINVSDVVKTLGDVKINAQLYRVPCEKTHYTVTLNVRTYSNNIEQTRVVNVKKGSDISFTFGSHDSYNAADPMNIRVWDTSDALLESASMDSIAVGSTVTKTFTVNQDIVIDVGNDAWRTPSIKGISYTEPEIKLPVLAEGAEGELVGAVQELNFENGWSHMYTSLPATDSNGCMYYYYVVEQDADGYITNYTASNTSGMTEGYDAVYEDSRHIYSLVGGELVVTNQKATDQKGKLVVSKLLATGSDAYSGTVTFPIQITLKNRNNELVNNETYGGYKFTNGIYTANLKIGDSITFTDIPYGYRYEVTETDLTPETSYYGFVGKTITNGAGTIAAAETDADVANKYKTPTTFKITKVWADNNNSASVRPAELNVQLYRKAGTAAETAYKAPVALNEAISWTYTWTNLPAEDEDGNAYSYLAKEVVVPSGYTATTTKNSNTSYTITNRLETTKLKVTKVWDDGGYSERPTSLPVKLVAKNSDGVTVNLAKKTTIEINKNLTAADAWTDEWTDLPQYIDGKKLTYGVEETLPEGKGYTSSSDKPDETTVILTNHRDAEETVLNVEKIWDDSDNKYSNRPATIQVQLYQTVKGNKSSVGSAVSISEDPVTHKWLYKWTGLPVEDGSGNVITYSVEEVGAVTGYIAPTYKEDKTNNKITITNKAEGNTSVTVNKIWDDNNDQDGKRKAFNAVLSAATADGDVTSRLTGVVTTQELNMKGNWTFTWTSLPKYIDGKEVTYSVTEPTPPDGYTLAGTSQDGNTFTLTNKHTPEVVTKRVEKKWDNESGNPEPGYDNIYVRLTKNTEAIETSQKVLNAASNWKAEWTNLPKYENGVEIAYSVEELTKIPNYGWTVMADDTDPDKIWLYNSLPAVYTDVNVEKTWDDAYNQDGKRPETIMVKLLADGAVVDTQILSAGNGWKYQWKNLLYKTNKPMHVVQYTVAEVELPEDYTMTQTTKTSDSSNAEGVYTTDIAIKNSYTPKTVEKTVKKIWTDKDNADNTRPAQVAVKLVAKVDGTDITGELTSVAADQTLDAAVSWTYTWTALPQYHGGKEIEYSVVETIDSSWADDYSTYYITNSSGEMEIHNVYPKSRNISVNKKWSDENDRDGIRPDNVTVHLLADGVEVTGKSPQVLNAGNDWTYVWYDLPVQNSNPTPSDINYSIIEDKVTGYEELIDASDMESKGEITITNTHESEVTEVFVNKQWEDKVDSNKRPAYVRAQLYADGVALAGKTITLDAAGSWKGSWKDLPKKKDGNNIVYTVKEVNVPIGYKCTVASSGADNTFTLINTRVIPKDVSFSKRGITGDDELIGARLKVIDSSGNVVEQWTSGLDMDDKQDNLPHIITDLEVNEIYTLIEDTAPAGYEAITETQFKVNTEGKVELITDKADENVSVSGDRSVIINDQYTSVKISKVDITTDKELPGAHLQILDEAGKVVVIDGKNVEWDSTDTSYEVKGLTTGKKYIIRETVAPSGYTITTDTYFQLDKYGKVESSTSLTTAKISGKEENLLLVEDGLTKLNFTKVGLINESCSDEASATAPLEGVSFGVYTVGADGKPGDTPVKTAVSNKNGTVVFDGIPAGKYAVKEISTIEPYVLDTNIYYADVSDDETKNFEGLKDADGKLITGNKLVNDQYRADIVLTKVSEYNPKEALPNSTYGLYKVTDAVGTEKLITTAVTDEQGLLTFKGVVTGVTYKVREMAPPDGYYVSKNPVTISFKVDNGKAVLSAVDGGDGTATIDANGNITWLEPSVIVSFAKTDEAGNYLAGAVLTVKDANGNVVKAKDGTTDLTWTSTSAAYEVEGVFEIGKTYTLEEVTAPKGYKKAEPVAFTIPSETVASNENKIVTVTMVDKKSKKTTDEDEEETSTTGTKSKTKTKTGDNAPVKTAAGLFVAMWLMFIYLRIKKEKL